MYDKYVKDHTYFPINSNSHARTKHFVESNVHEKRKEFAEPAGLHTHIIQIFGILTCEVFVHVISFFTISLEKSTRCCELEFLLDHKKQRGQVPEDGWLQRGGRKLDSSGQSGSAALCCHLLGTTDEQSSLCDNTFVRFFPPSNQGHSETPLTSERHPDVPSNESIEVLIVFLSKYQTLPLRDSVVKSPERWSWKV